MRLIAALRVRARGSQKGQDPHLSLIESKLFTARDQNLALDVMAPAVCEIHVRSRGLIVAGLTKDSDSMKV